MYRTIFNLYLILKLAACQRRITNGSSVDSSADTSFVVYIVAASTDDTDPGWLCGGSIIHPSLVLTSAACLRVGTQKMYVVAGYRVYVRTENLENDDCTRRTKKRIVSYCTHYYYAYDEGRKSSEERKYKWTKFDIAIARTDTPIDFYDNDYKKYCSYLPSLVRTNYNSRYEKPKSDVVVYGWGHAVYYRPEGDLTDYNEKYLRYASSIIMTREECMGLFKGEYLRLRVRHNFLCADDKGNFDSLGRYLVTVPPLREACQRNRRSGNDSFYSKNRTACIKHRKDSENSSNDTIHVIHSTRRNGICQNDHGGPLVRWIGGRPFVIGIASAFQVNKKMECVGPYLYSSVLCTSRFITCHLEEQKSQRRSASNCSEPEKGYKMEEIYIDWTSETSHEQMSYEDLNL